MLPLCLAKTCPNFHTDAFWSRFRKFYFHLKNCLIACFQHNKLCEPMTSSWFHSFGFQQLSSELSFCTEQLMSTTLPLTGLAINYFSFLLRKECISQLATGCVDVCMNLLPPPPPLPHEDVCFRLSAFVFVFFFFHKSGTSHSKTQICLTMVSHGVRSWHVTFRLKKTTHLSSYKSIYCKTFYDWAFPFKIALICSDDLVLIPGLLQHLNQDQQV